MKKKKSTDELLKLLSKEQNLTKFLSDNADEFETHTLLHTELEKLRLEHQVSKADIIRLSNLDKTYAYQIFDGTRKSPSRNKLLAICISCGASLAETQRILRIGRQAQLHPRVIRDSVIIFAIENGRTLQLLNETLSDLNQEIIS